MVFVLFFVICFPLPFAKAVGAPSFWTSKTYPMGLVEEGNADAGFKGNSNEFAYFSTSRWTQFAVDLRLGNLVSTANLVAIPGTMIPMTFSLSYSSFNSNVDIGLGKGYTSNLHACVSEDSQNHNITFVTGSGAKMVFTWDANNSVYINPPGFTGFAVENQDGTYKIQTLGGEILTFLSTGKLSTISSLAGGLLNVGYDGSGRPLTLTDAKSSRVITLTWSTGGKVTGVTDSMNNSWILTYDGNDNLTGIQQPSNESPNPEIHTSYGYDNNHKMISQTDFEGFTYDITYHSSGYQTGKVASFVEPTANDATTEFLYEEDEDGFDKKTTMTDGADRETYFYFSDTSLHLEKMSAGSGTTERKTEYDYNNLGLVSAIRDSYGSETVNAYDSVGHTTSITLPAVGGTSYVREFTYDPPNDVLGKLTQSREKVTSSVWATTIFAYNDQYAPYSPSTITNPANQTTTIAYNSDKQPTSVITATDGGSKTVTLEYSSTTGNVTSVTDFSGNETVLVYNNNGFVTEKIEYEGSALTGVMLNDILNTINELSIATGTANVTTNETTSSQQDDNGGTTSTTSETGCGDSVATSDTTGVAPRGFQIIGSGFAGAGDIIYLPPVVPFDPNPITTSNTRGHVTTYEFDEGGAGTSTTDYLGRETAYSRDSFGGVASVTNPYGKLTEYGYNNNGQTVEVDVEGTGTYTFTRDLLGQVTSVVDPIQGTLSYTYNVRGDVLTSPDGSFSRDILGRTTEVSYPGGGSDSISYTPEGWLSSFTSASFGYDALGNQTSWNDGSSSSTISYAGNGSSKLGLPASITGSGNAGSYSYSYNARHWLSSMTDTGKNKTFTYAFNNDSTLASIDYPNDTTLNQTWANKALDGVTVTKDQDTYLTIDSTFDTNDQITEYDTSVYAGQNTTFDETNQMTYDTLSRISTLDYASTSKTLTYSYDTSVGKLSSILDSELDDSYDFSYDTKGRLSSVVYPDNQGTSSYSYDDTNGQGRLYTVTYPGNRTMTLTWDGRDRITQVSLNDDGTITIYSLSYNGMNKLSRIAKSVGGLSINSWNFYYGPLGVEKAIVKDSSNTVILTQDYTLDKSGTILSMTYTPTGFGGPTAGELYMAYDPCGNLSLMTDSTGSPVASYAYNRGTSGVSDAYNPNGVVNVFTTGAKQGNVTVPGFGDDEITIPEHPGQIGTITDVVAVDVTATGTGATVYNPGCGEVGTCKFKTPEDLFNECMTSCYKNKTGRSDWVGDAEKYAKWQALQKFIDRGLDTIFLKDIPAFVKKVLKLDFSDFLTGVFGVQGVIDSLEKYLDDLKSVADATQKQKKLEKDNSWLNNCADRKIARDALASCSDSCHYLLGDGNY